MNFGLFSSTCFQYFYHSYPKLLIFYNLENFQLIIMPALDKIQVCNYALISVLFLSLIWYIFTCIRINMFKKKIVPMLSQTMPSSQNGWTLPPINQVVEKESLANLRTIALAITSSVPISFIYYTVNNMSPSILASFPYFRVLHVFHHGVGFYSNSFLLLIFLSKSKQMRTVIIRELSERITF